MAEPTVKYEVVRDDGSVVTYEVPRGTKREPMAGRPTQRRPTPASR